MWMADSWRDYELLDCGGGEKLERWGGQVLLRPDPQAIWNTPRLHSRWRNPDGRYFRSSTGGGRWDKGRLPEQWQVSYRELTFQVKPMNFKHTGLFPEQAVNWDFAMERIRSAGRHINVLNLFAYTGAASVACAAAGASVCHVDAAKGMVAWAKENAKASGLADAPIRYIVDDCAKFVEREIRRGRRPQLRTGPHRRGLEAGGEPVPLHRALREGALGESPLCHRELLHHRPGPQRADLPDGADFLPPPRGPYRQRRAGPPGDGDRPSPPLRVHRPLDG